MASSIAKDFYLWVVPGGDGRVRKVRITLVRLAIVALILVNTVFCLLLVLGDYARVQLLRTKNAIWIEMLEHERRGLIATNRALESEVQGLRDANSRVLNYETSIKERLDRLSKVLRSSTSLAVRNTPEQQSQKVALNEKDSVDEIKRDANGAGKGGFSRPKLKKDIAYSPGSATTSEGIGGAEVVCSGSRCPEDISDPYLMLESNALMGLLERASKQGSDDVVKALDAYLDLIEFLPLANPLPGVGVSSPFGYRMSPFSHGPSVHEGLDLDGRYGARIRSAGGGMVESVKRNGTYGLMVDVRHSDRVVTRYAHLSRALVQEGQGIMAGDTLGLVGSSGRSTGPHLHYEVIVDGKPINPQGFLSLARRLQSVL